MYHTFSVQLFASEECINRIMTILGLNSKAGFLALGINNTLAYSDKRLSRVIFDILNLLLKRNEDLLIFPSKCKGKFITTIRVKEQSLQYFNTLYKVKIAKHIKEVKEIFYEDGETKSVEKINEIEGGTNFKISLFMNIGLITAIDLSKNVFKLKL